MTIGDGSNDLQLVGNAGIGVAMGNAVEAVKDVAAFVTDSNDEDGMGVLGLKAAMACWAL